MGDIIINGTITTVGPLSISMPDGSGYGDFPIMSRGLNADGEKLLTGYLPATTIRGFLRRAIVTSDMKQAAESNKHYSLPKAYSELIGQDAASEKQAGEIDLLEIKKAREESPVIDLFGSGLGVASRLRMGHFVPNVNVLPDQYYGVRKDLGDSDGVIDLLTEDDATAYYGRETSNSRRAQAEANVGNLKRQIRAAKRKDEEVSELNLQLEEAEKLSEKFKTEMGDMQVSSRTIVDHYALPAGIDLHGRMVIINAKDRDLSMLEFGLDCLSKSPVLGAHSARGCGEICGSFDVLVDGEMKKKITIGGYDSAKIDSF